MRERGEDEPLDGLEGFMLFYKQTASCVYLLDTLLGGFGSFRLTFSNVSGPPDAQVCIFIMRERPEDGKSQLLFQGKRGNPGLREPLKEGTIRYTMALDSVLLT